MSSFDDDAAPVSKKAKMGLTEHLPAIEEKGANDDFYYYYDDKSVTSFKHMEAVKTDEPSSKEKLKTAYEKSYYYYEYYYYSGDGDYTYEDDYVNP